MTMIVKDKRARKSVEECISDEFAISTEIAQLLAELGSKFEAQRRNLSLIELYFLNCAITNENTAEERIMLSETARLTKQYKTVCDLSCSRVDSITKGLVATATVRSALRSNYSTLQHLVTKGNV